MQYIRKASSYRTLFIVYERKKRREIQKRYIAKHTQSRFSNGKLKFSPANMSRKLAGCIYYCRVLFIKLTWCYFFQKFVHLGSPHIRYWRVSRNISAWRRMHEKKRNGAEYQKNRNSCHSLRCEKYFTICRRNKVLWNIWEFMRAIERSCLWNFRTFKLHMTFEIHMKKDLFDCLEWFCALRFSVKNICNGFRAKYYTGNKDGGNLNILNTDFCMLRIVFLPAKTLTS